MEGIIPISYTAGHRAPSPTRSHTLHARSLTEKRFASDTACEPTAAVPPTGDTATGALLPASSTAIVRMRATAVAGAEAAAAADTAAGTGGRVGAVAPPPPLPPPPPP